MELMIELVLTLGEMLGLVLGGDRDRDRAAVAVAVAVTVRLRLGSRRGYAVKRRF